VAKPNYYVTLPNQLVKKSLKNTTRLLIFVGKPLFKILIAVVIATSIFNSYFYKNIQIIQIFAEKLRISVLWKSVNKKQKPLKYYLSQKKKFKPLIKKLKAAGHNNFFKKLNKVYKTYLVPARQNNLKITIGNHVFVSKSFKLIFKVFAVLTLTSFALTAFIKLILPSPHNLSRLQTEISTKIYDRNGVLLYKIYKDKNRSLATFEELPKNVIDAFIASEDSEFFKHKGFSLKGILRAVVKNFKEKRLTGGSTITQQLVKNTLLTPEKTYSRKLKEILLAILVEQKYEKQKIFEMYINEVSFGGTVYGVKEAAYVYFKKDLNELTHAESALLAGLPKSPTTYSPFGQNPQLSFERQKEVLRLMLENSYINQKEFDEAVNEKVYFAQNKSQIKAPHFVIWVRELLEKEFGKEMVENGGLNVITTLDYDIQKKAENVAYSEIKKLKNLNVNNASVLVIKPETGELLAMVGSIDYFDQEYDGNVNVSLRKRQPGSSIKVVNYAYALSNGYSPSTIISDTPITYISKGQPPYSPKNYDGAFKGLMTLRDALAQSRNVPAVKVLNSYGVSKMVDLGEKMGIESWIDRSRFGLSLTLGGGEVTLLELAKIYSTIANYGNQVEINPYISISNSSDKIVYENHCLKQNLHKTDINITINKDVKTENRKISCSKNQVLDERIAFQIIDILKDNNARSPAFGINSLLNIKEHPEVAVKTGTSNDLKDNYAIGFTKDFLVAVWVGNNDSSPMSHVASGITGATPIWNNILTHILSSKPSKNWEVPDGVVKIGICSQIKSSDSQPCYKKFEWFLQENISSFIENNPNNINNIGRVQEGNSIN
jgi:penicillin-binding protein 1C